MNVHKTPKRASGPTGPGAIQPEQSELESLFGGPISTLPLRATNSPRLFHGRLSDYLWCACCKRTFPNGTFRQVGDFRRCPYAECGGHASVDAMPWELIKAGNPDYPSVPALGTHYPRPQAARAPSARL